MKTINGLIEYIDHIVASLNADYDVLYDDTRLFRNQIKQPFKDRLDWNSVHIHTSLNTLLTDLKRHQEYLKKGIDASTTL
jgi:hypothetical protein